MHDLLKEYAQEIPAADASAADCTSVGTGSIDGADRTERRARVRPLRLFEHFRSTAGVPARPHSTEAPE